AQELVRRGHSVTLLNRTRKPGNYSGVECVSLAQSQFQTVFDRSDIVVSIYCDGQLLRNLGVCCPLVLWTGHNSDEPTMQKLHQQAERDAWDTIVFKSQTQADEFKTKFGLTETDYHVIGNAISPIVAANPLREKFFFQAADSGPKLIYTSTPFRGLETLLKAWPRIREAFPASTLDIYSGMRVYQQKSEQQFTDLYQQCHDLAGVAYFGSVNQTELATAYARADVLAYPSIFRETSCITVMESMASGCMVVSTKLGAVPETCAGYGVLIDIPKTNQASLLVEDYASALIHAVNQVRSNPDQAAHQLTKQQRFARQFYYWPKRAADFEQLMVAMIAQRPGRASSSGLGSPASIPRVQSIRLPSDNNLYVNLRDRRARHLVDSAGSFNTETMAIWKQLLAEDSWTHVVDVGANYGEMLATVPLPAEAMVLAIEPNPAVLPCLKLTLGGLEQVTLCEVAISNRSGTVDFFVDPDWSGTSRITKNDQANARLPVTTLDSLLNLSRSRLRRARILIKIDVEGFEIRVLRGALRTLGFADRAVALIELTHVAPKYHSWLLKYFSVFGYDLQSHRLRELTTLDRPSLETAGIFPNDIVLRHPRFLRTLATISLHGREVVRTVMRSLGLTGRSRAA
ncbi:MAG: hypothetical protein RIS70_3252, partial [Planctomycetota bacterium]